MPALASVFLAFLPAIAAIFMGTAAVSITYDLVGNLTPIINSLGTVASSANSSGPSYISAILTYFQVGQMMQLVLASITGALSAKAAMYAAKIAQSALIKSSIGA